MLAFTTITTSHGHMIATSVLRNWYAFIIVKMSHCPTVTIYGLHNQLPTNRVKEELGSKIARINHSNSPNNEIGSELVISQSWLHDFPISDCSA